MEVSARNQIKGTIRDIKLGSVMAKVAVEIAGGTILNSVITVDSVQGLDLKVGEQITVLIKSTEAMIGK